MLRYRILDLSRWSRNRSLLGTALRSVTIAMLIDYSAITNRPPRLLGKVVLEHVEGLCIMLVDRRDATQMPRLRRRPGPLTRSSGTRGIKGQAALFAQGDLAHPLPPKLSLRLAELRTQEAVSAVTVSQNGVRLNNWKTRVARGYERGSCNFELSYGFEDCGRTKALRLRW